MASSARLVLDEVLEHFGKLEDPRSSINRLHPLESVMVIAILGAIVTMEFVVRQGESVR